MRDDEFLTPIKDVLYKKYGFKLQEKFNVMTADDQKVEVVLISDCLIGDTFSPNRYEPLFNADTLHLRLRANITEKQFLELFDIDSTQKIKLTQIIFSLMLKFSIHIKKKGFK